MWTPLPFMTGLVAQLREPGQLTASPCWHRQVCPHCPGGQTLWDGPRWGRSQVVVRDSSHGPSLSNGHSALGQILLFGPASSPSHSFAFPGSGQEAGTLLK